MGEGTFLEGREKIRLDLIGFLCLVYSAYSKGQKKLSFKMAETPPQVYFYFYFFFKKFLTRLVSAEFVIISSIHINYRSHKPNYFLFYLQA